MRQIAILGSTGSIGANALDVIRSLNGGGRGAFRVWGLSAQTNAGVLKTQIQEFRPHAVVVTEKRAAMDVRTWAKRRHPALRVWEGETGLARMAAQKNVDLLLSSVVGSVGLLPLLTAVRAGKKVALANKEALIVAGDLLTGEAKKSGARLLPVDSEHSAIFQCLQSSPRKHVRRIILTASGGAFYRRTDSLDRVTVREALAHPTWKMGHKITIDCATLMNKGLEAIEAHHLFNVPMEKIEIVIHPQSIVHSLVEFTDGAMLAQLSHPDMRLPIQYALTHPDRLPTSVRPLELHEIQKLEFFKPDFSRFPCLALALKAGARGGTWPAVLNGANEAAVRAFMHERIRFTDIARLTGDVTARHASAGAPTLENILEADRWARAAAEDWIETNNRKARRPARRSSGG